MDLIGKGSEKEESVVSSALSRCPLLNSSLRKEAASSGVRVFGSEIRTSAAMAEHEEKKGESLVEKISEKIHGDDSSSSSDSEDEKPSELKAKIFRLFGREKPVHQVFGGGKRKLFTLLLLKTLLDRCAWISADDDDRRMVDRPCSELSF